MTNEELITGLRADIDTQAAAMAVAIETFKTAYIAAHAADLAVLKLGGNELGQRIDQDRLATIKTPAHSIYNDAGAQLFDGMALQPNIYAAVDTIIAELQASHPEAFE